MEKMSNFHPSQLQVTKNTLKEMKLRKIKKAEENRTEVKIHQELLFLESNLQLLSASGLANQLTALPCEVSLGRLASALSTHLLGKTMAK